MLEVEILVTAKIPRIDKVEEIVEMFEMMCFGCW